MKHPLVLGAALATTLASLAVLAPALAQSSAAQATPAGRWITESGNLEVELAPCGDAVCGTVVRVLANRSMSGPGQEMAPADQRPALGLVLLSGLRPAGEGELQGSIYNRENAKSYSATLKLAAPDQLLVRAYVGLPLFGKTQVWHRPAPPSEAANPSSSQPGAAQ